MMMANAGLQRSVSSFANIPMGPPDPIFGLTDAFNKVRLVYVASHHEMAQEEACSRYMV